MNPLNLNRRRLLIGLAAASTAATVTAVPALAAASQPATETPELIRLGDALPGIDAAHTAAVAALAAADAEWLPRWPFAPDTLAKTVRDHRTQETDFAGRWIVREGEEHARSLWTVAELDDDIAEVTKALRRKRSDPFAPFGAWTRLDGFAKRCREEWQMFLGLLNDRREVAAAYEAERGRIAVACNYRALKDAADDARRILKKTVQAIMAQPVEGMGGVIIKSQALAAWGRLDDLHRAFDADLVAMSLWGPTLAADLMRIAEGETAA